MLHIMWKNIYISNHNLQLLFLNIKLVWNNIYMYIRYKRGKTTLFVYVLYVNKWYNLPVLLYNMWEYTYIYNPKLPLLLQYKESVLQQFSYVYYLNQLCNDYSCMYSSYSSSNTLIDCYISWEKIHKYQIPSCNLFFQI